MKIADPKAVDNNHEKAITDPSETNSVMVNLDVKQLTIAQYFKDIGS